eukprot:scaffold1.g5427.t1
MAVSQQSIETAKADIKKLIAEKRANPILISPPAPRAQGVDAPWPVPGGATASIRFKPELSHGANNGLSIALGLLEPIKAKASRRLQGRRPVPDLSWADLIQLASALSVSEAGGPFIPLRLGRKDAARAEDCTPDGRLPAAGAPFPDEAPSPAAHLRNVFYRMGLDDRDIVALSGAHTLGRARPERSGWGKPSTKYTEKGPGAPGGQSWTVEWLEFDNSYFRDIKEQKDADLLVLPTDAALFEDVGFKPFAERYAADQDAFFADYVPAHLKLSELGVAWDGEPVTLTP